MAFVSLVAKSYSSDEEEKIRSEKFAKNFAAVLKHNAEEALGMHKYTMGLNEYSDMVRLFSTLL